MMVRFHAHAANLKILQVYLPMSEKSADVVKSCYSQIEQIRDTFPNRGITMIIGDFNAKFGREKEGN